ncbi:AraC family transcriptional regulator [Lachnotalea glycerini]|uniref:AraC family transcriptional regulator n=1 Tax=Lachnotalea glycerini TaxID=1763509 RepID=A0A371JDT9_9FIRM|nr:AraC family transcriptional regulator [Lachnotalea glycerini]RDY30885.1 AraC family transcriptional regulator [Lachnotalea glycerini]
MRYFICDAVYPMKYLSCGNLISKQGFLHQKRNIDSHVLIMVNEGHLYLSQGGVKYELGPKTYIFLKANEEHFGYQASTGRLSYYWVHFETPSTIEDLTIKNLYNTLFTGEALPFKNNLYIMPESGKAGLTQKVSVLFNQLLDLSRQEMLYTRQIIDYALSLLIMEISQEFIDLYNNRTQKISPNVAHVMEWIKANYYKQISIFELAGELGYNPDYLSSLFKKTTKITLTQFINQVRIENSKALLTNFNISIKETAYSCGFLDEKYFMKTFKKIVGMTPSQYKMAFTKRKIN